MFLPIMRGTLNLPAARDPEVLERLDPSGTLNLCLRYQQHLSLCSNAIAADQNKAVVKIKEVSPLSSVYLILELISEIMSFIMIIGKIFINSRLILKFNA